MENPQLHLLAREMLEMRTAAAFCCQCDCGSSSRRFPAVRQLNSLSLLASSDWLSSSPDALDKVNGRWGMRLSKSQNCLALVMTSFVPTRRMCLLNHPSRYVRHCRLESKCCQRRLRNRRGHLAIRMTSVKSAGGRSVLDQPFEYCRQCGVAVRASSSQVSTPVHPIQNCLNRNRLSLLPDYDHVTAE